MLWAARQPGPGDAATLDAILACEVGNQLASTAVGKLARRLHTVPHLHLPCGPPSDTKERGVVKAVVYWGRLTLLCAVRGPPGPCRCQAPRLQGPGQERLSGGGGLADHVHQSHGRLGAPPPSHPHTLTRTRTQTHPLLHRPPVRPLACSISFDVFLSYVSFFSWRCG